MVNKTNQNINAKQGIDNIDDFDFDGLDVVLEPQVTVNKSNTVNTDSEEAHKHEYKDNSFTIFWRSNAMMSIMLAQDGVLLKFMLGEGKDPKNNTYYRESRTLFSIDKEELFGIIHQLNIMYKAVLDGKMANPVTLVHNYNNETKTLQIAQSPKEPGKVYVTLVKDKNKYVISMNAVDFKFFLFALKMILYEIYTGTRQGFTFNWI